MVDEFDPSDDEVSVVDEELVPTTESMADGEGAVGTRVGTDEEAGVHTDAEPERDDGLAYRPLHEAAVYDTIVDRSAENDAHGLIVRMAGQNKRVLELGCATGATTKVLQQTGCAVIAVEIDPDAAQIAEQFAERVIVSDLETLDIEAALGEDSFDVIIAADVLEHLRDPARILKGVLHHLRPGGEVLISIPNVTHADVRLSLLRGDFNYQWCGILDETHLRFFTRQTLAAFLADCGLTVMQWDRTVRAIGETEIEWKPVDDQLLEWVGAQEDADTYQFVLRAIEAAEGSHLAEAIEMRDAAWVEVMRLRPFEGAHGQLTERLALLQGDNDELADAVARLELRTAEMQARFDADESARVGLVELEALVGRDGATFVRTAADLETAATELKTTRRERDEFQASFDALAGIQEELAAVRRSESYRLGRALVSPLVTLRRMGRAWRRAKPGR